MPIIAPLTSGDTVTYTGPIVGYFTNPGTVTSVDGSGNITITWADGFSISFLPPGHPLLADMTSP